jgi:hypothetical protein
MVSRVRKALLQHARIDVQPLVRKDVYCPRTPTSIGAVVDVDFHFRHLDLF